MLRTICKFGIFIFQLMILFRINKVVQQHCRAGNEAHGQIRELRERFQIRFLTTWKNPASDRRHQEIPENALAGWINGFF